MDNRQQHPGRGYSPQHRDMRTRGGQGASNVPGVRRQAANGPQGGASNARGQVVYPRQQAARPNTVPGRAVPNGGGARPSRGVPGQASRGAAASGARNAAAQGARSVAGGTPVPAQSRQNSQASYVKLAHKRRRSRLLKRVGLTVLAVLLVCVFAAGGYGLWFSHQLDSALSMGAEQDMAVSDALTPAEMGKPFYVLVLGSDSREGSGTSDKAAESGDNQRSDVMILMRVDASNKQITMVTVPRDTPYRTSDGQLMKINEAYNIGGAPESIKAVSQLTGVDISHYAEVHFSELQDIVDKLGGVEVNVDIELSYEDALTGETVTLEPGTQVLNGQQAQLFARARHEYKVDQDEHRQDNVRQLALAIMNKVLSEPVYQMPNTILSVAGFVGTDMRTSDIVSLAMSFAGGSGSMTVYSTSGPSKGDFNDEAGGLWMCYENPEGWSAIMSAVDAGENPKGIEVDSTAIVP